MEEVSSHHLLSLTAITVHHCHQVALTLWVFVCVCVHVCKYACDIGVPFLGWKSDLWKMLTYNLLGIYTLQSPLGEHSSC